MQSELAELEWNKVFEVNSSTKRCFVVGIKMVFKNKVDKEGNVFRNNARLFVKGYTKQEGIHYVEPFLLSQDLRLWEIFLHIQLTRTSMFIKWIDVNCAFLSEVL